MTKGRVRFLLVFVILVVILSSFVSAEIPWTESNLQRYLDGAQVKGVDSDGTVRYSIPGFPPNVYLKIKPNDEHVYFSYAVAGANREKDQKIKVDPWGPDNSYYVKLYGNQNHDDQLVRTKILASNTQYISSINSRISQSENQLQQLRANLANLQKESSADPRMVREINERNAEIAKAQQQLDSTRVQARIFEEVMRQDISASYVNLDASRAALQKEIADASRKKELVNDAAEKSTYGNQIAVAQAKLKLIDEMESLPTQTRVANIDAEIAQLKSNLNQPTTAADLHYRPGWQSELRELEKLRTTILGESAAGNTQKPEDTANTPQEVTETQVEAPKPPTPPPKDQLDLFLDSLSPAGGVATSGTTPTTPRPETAPTGLIKEKDGYTAITYAPNQALIYKEGRLVASMKEGKTVELTPANQVLLSGVTHDKQGNLLWNKHKILPNGVNLGTGSFTLQNGEVRAQLDDEKNGQLILELRGKANPEKGIPATTERTIQEVSGGSLTGGKVTSVTEKYEGAAEGVNPTTTTIYQLGSGEGARTIKIDVNHLSALEHDDTLTYLRQAAQLGANTASIRFDAEGIKASKARTYYDSLLKSKEVSQANNEYKELQKEIKDLNAKISKDHKVTDRKSDSTRYEDMAKRIRSSRTDYAGAEYNQVVNDLVHLGVIDTDEKESVLADFATVNPRQTNGVDANDPAVKAATAELDALVEQGVGEAIKRKAEIDSDLTANEKALQAKEAERDEVYNTLIETLSKDSPEGLEDMFNRLRMTKPQEGEETSEKKDGEGIIEVLTRAGNDYVVDVAPTKIATTPTKKWGLFAPTTGGKTVTLDAKTKDVTLTYSDGSSVIVGQDNSKTYTDRKGKETIEIEYTSPGVQKVTDHTAKTTFTRTTTKDGDQYVLTSGTQPSRAITYTAKGKKLVTVSGKQYEFKGDKLIDPKTKKEVDILSPEQLKELKDADEKIQKAAKKEANEKAREADNSRRGDSISTAQQVFKSISMASDWGSGMSGYSSLFMSDDDLAEWREGVDKTFASLYLGSEYWASAICARKLDTNSGQQVAYTFGPNPYDQASPAGGVSVAATCAGERMRFDDPITGTRYLYRVNFFVNNPSDNKMTFNVKLSGDASTNIFKNDVEIDAFGSFARSGSSSFVQYSTNVYDTCCVQMNNGPPIAAGPNPVCNRIADLTGSPGEPRAGPPAGGGSQGGASGGSQQQAQSEYNQI